MLQNLKHIIFAIVGLFLINLLVSRFYTRLDLTSDKRYTLSETTKNILKKVDQDIRVTVYLEGDFPLDFKRLQQATKQHLEELKSHNSHIRFTFNNPLGLEKELIEKGMQPSRLTIEENGSIKEVVIFPWAEISYKNKTTLVPLLFSSNQAGTKQLQHSIENLEYAYSNAINSLMQEKRKSIAVLRGNGELDNIYLYDFLNNLKSKYNLAEYTLESANNFPQNTLDGIKKYDLLLIAKPTKAFTENEKLVLDQYITNGGKSLWLVDYVMAEMDSLQETGEAYFLPRDLNLTDLLFSYGARINHDLVQDLYASKIAIATGNIGNKTQFNQFLWHHYPLVKPTGDHAVSKNVEAVNLKFPSSIDTLKNDINKHILLQSSPLTKVMGLPNLVSLSAIANKPTPDDFNSKSKFLGVLLEGEFQSAYTHKTKPFETDFIATGKPNKMIIISDGDIIANQVSQGEPTKMEIDKWTGQHFGNKDFLNNTVDYLLDDTGLLAIRGKMLNIKLLNKEKIYKQRLFWQGINIVFPLVTLLIFGLIYRILRRKKYT